jgi:hypothetical protein
MCFVLAWKTGFAERYVAPILSHHKHGTLEVLIPSSLRMVCTHMTSAVAFAKALYSASVLDLDTVGCLRALQDMIFDPKKTLQIHLWTFYHQYILPNLHLKMH